jgi:sugar diacid utilization regulator
MEFPLKKTNTQRKLNASGVSLPGHVYVNTTRYRLRKAEELLGTEQASAQEHIAWGLASSIWMSFHSVE